MVKNISVVDGVEIFAPESETVFGFPSDERAFFTAGPKQEHLPIKALIASIRDNKGPLLTNADVAKLIAFARKEGGDGQLIGLQLTHSGRWSHGRPVA